MESLCLKCSGDWNLQFGVLGFRNSPIIWVRGCGFFCSGFLIHWAWDCGIAAFEVLNSLVVLLGGAMVRATARFFRSPVARSVDC